MPERYKLRLKDGSLLSVDRDDLGTWLVDDDAMVQADGSPDWRPLAEVLAEPRQDASSARGPAKLADLPVIPLKPLDEPPPPTEKWIEPAVAERHEEVARIESPPSGALPAAVRWYEAAGDWVFRRFRREPPVSLSLPTETPAARAAIPVVFEPPAPSVRPTPVETPAPRVIAPAPVETPALRAIAPAPVKPPLPFGDTPVLRFAETHDEEIERFEEDVYEGGERWYAIAWLWVKRVVLVGGLAAGGIVAFRTFETWWPWAQRSGMTVFSEVDKRAQSSTVNKIRTQALEKAIEQMPHLAPDTILLVMSTSVSGVLEPPEAFRRAYEAEERGMLALTAQEAQELRALRRQILVALSANDRETALDYDRVRAHRVPFPFEDGRVLELYARGARALPPESRQRLQTLTGKAVAAGLEPVSTAER